MPDSSQTAVREAGLLYMRDIMLANISSAAAALDTGGAAADITVSRPDDLVDALGDRQLQQVEDLENKLPAGISEDEAARIIDDYESELERVTELLEQSGFDTADVGDLRETAISAASDESTAAITKYFDSLREELIG